jgi:hypothetical protein
MELDYENDEFDDDFEAEEETPHGLCVECGEPLTWAEAHDPDDMSHSRCTMCVPRLL